MRSPITDQTFTAFFALFVALQFGAFDLAQGQNRPTLSRPSVYSPSTIVVCNQRVEGSETLAKYYAQARGIPSSNLIYLETEITEEITREQFNQQIAEPIRTAMLANSWWVPIRDPKTGEQTLRSKINVITLIHGVPVKIANDQPPEAEPGQSTAASVDTELSILGQPKVDRAGPINNPYFGNQFPFHAADMPILLVGRIDGPSVATCKRIIDDTLQAEMNGLWGQAYIDLDQPAEPAKRLA